MVPVKLTQKLARADHQVGDTVQHFGYNFVVQPDKTLLGDMPRQDVENQLAAGRIILFNPEAPDEGGSPSLISPDLDLKEMGKEELAAYALDVFGVDIDKRLKTETLCEHVQRIRNAVKAGKPVEVENLSGE